jgi:hypothetical protein
MVGERDGRIGSATPVKILRVLTGTLGLVLATAAPCRAVDLDQLTVVTLARDGSWGVATAGSQGQALAAAIGDCRAMSGPRSDCGAQFLTTRGGWVIANLCGDHKIMVGADSREAAEQAARLREADLRHRDVPNLPPCVHMLTVDSRGAVQTRPTAPPHQLDAQKKPR